MIKMKDYNYKYFNEEQIEELKMNPYVKNVTKSTITYTNQFREEFYIAYSNGTPPSVILRNMGFDTKMLGKVRINNITKRIKNMAKREDGFDDMRTEKSGRKLEHELTQEEYIAYLEHQIKYKDQQIEALKKINFVDKKAQWKPLKKNTK